MYATYGESHVRVLLRGKTPGYGDQRSLHERIPREQFVIWNDSLDH